MGDLMCFSNVWNVCNVECVWVCDCVCGRERVRERVREREGERVCVSVCVGVCVCVCVQFLFSITACVQKVTPVHVNHPVFDNGEAYGFIIEKGEVAILFTQDTAATDRIWEVGKKFKNLKAIFTEVSFPNHMQNVADLSYHHSPNSMREEEKKMPKDIPIYLGHLKPNYQEQLIQEITDLKNPRFHIMYADDVRYSFD